MIVRSVGFFAQGEEKFTFVEGCKNPKSITVLLKGSTKYGLNQLKDALRDGLRSITNTLEDGSVACAAMVLTDR